MNSNPSVVIIIIVVVVVIVVIAEHLLSIAIETTPPSHHRWTGYFARVIQPARRRSNTLRRPPVQCPPPKLAR
jgi:hypothetical protein